MKNDRLDAKLLAQLCRAGMIAESYVPSSGIRELRSLARGRKRLVEKRTDFKNEVHALLDQQGISYDWDPFSAAGRDHLADDQLDLSPIAEQLLTSFLSIIDAFSEQIKELERVIEDTAASLEETQILMTIPGVSFFSGLLIHAGIGEIDRFDPVEEFVSYAKLDPVVKDGRYTKGRWHLQVRQFESAVDTVQCAKVAVGTMGD